jgi:hypothetical protein
MRLTIDLCRSRVETKYSLAAEDLPALAGGIPCDQREDYGVLTHYFDRPDGSLARRAFEDPRHCTKIRTRQYPEDSSVWFEVKTRRGSWTRKSRLRLCRAEARGLVRGLGPGEAEALGPLRDQKGGDGDAEARFYLRELAQGALLPVGAVYAYRRTFLAGEDRVRITIDQEISYYRPCEVPFSDEDAMSAGLLLGSESGLVLEVKHAGVLPPWCKDLVSGLRRSKYSKFRNLVLSLAQVGKAADHVDRF